MRFIRRASDILWYYDGLTNTTSAGIFVFYSSVVFVLPIIYILILPKDDTNVCICPIRLLENIRGGTYKSYNTYMDPYVLMNLISLYMNFIILKLDICLLGDQLVTLLRVCQSHSI